MCLLLTKEHRDALQQVGLVNGRTLFGEIHVHGFNIGRCVSADALVRRGVKPSAAGLAELRSGCHRQFVQGVQTETAQRATDATQAGSPAPTAAAINQTEPKEPV
jgi:hypothetical protein